MRGFSTTVSSYAIDPSRQTSRRGERHYEGRRWHLTWPLRRAHAWINVCATRLPRAHGRRRPVAGSSEGASRDGSLWDAAMTETSRSLADEPAPFKDSVSV